jgi:hypothetical protein
MYRYLLVITSRMPERPALAAWLPPSKPGFALRGGDPADDTMNIRLRR